MKINNNIISRESGYETPNAEIVVFELKSNYLLDESDIEGTGDGGELCPEDDE